MSFKGNLPRFISKSDQCDWCRKWSELVDVEIHNEEGGFLKIIYECTNPNCECVKVFKKQNRWAFIDTGKRAIEIFKQKQKEAENKPADSVVVSSYPI